MSTCCWHVLVLVLIGRARADAWIPPYLTGALLPLFGNAIWDRYLGPVKTTAYFYRSFYCGTLVYVINVGYTKNGVV